MQRLFRWLDETNEELAQERLRLFVATAALANVGLLHTGIVKMRVDTTWQLCIALLPAMWMGLLAVARGYPRLGMAVQFVVLATINGVSYPGIANHAVLQMYLAGLLAVLPARPVDAPWVIGTLRWTFLSVVFMSAMQKLVHGSYWSGAYFGWSIADPTLGKMYWLLQHFVSPEEIERLRALRLSGEVGSFRPDAAALVWLSRGVLLAEIAVPVWMAIARRKVLPVALMAMAFSGIALMSRELVFGSLMLGMISMSLPVRWSRYVLVLQVLAIVFGSLRQTFFPYTSLN